VTSREPSRGEILELALELAEEVYSSAEVSTVVGIRALRTSGV
jgi:hypothetical protein